MSEKDDVLSLSVREFAAATAAKTPTPGGGSVAGAVGAVGVALGGDGAELHARQEEVCRA